jgi:hypothetical protein
MTEPKKLMPCTHSPPNTSIDSSQGKNDASSMSASTQSSIQITVREVPAEEAPPKAGPRRGGCTIKAWMCCTCKFHNKTGRRWCSNSNKEKCAGKLPEEETKSRPGSEKSLNHHRCEACYPSQFGVYVNGHSRRWPRGLDHMEKESVGEDADHELEGMAKKEFDKTLADRKPKPVQRDPLTWQRVGDWPM